MDPDHRLVAGELERQWAVALQGVAEARATAERYAQPSPTPQLSPAMRAQVQPLGQTLPELWARGHVTAAQQKEWLRRLIRRVLVTRPVPDTVEATIVWVRGAVPALEVPPPLQRHTDVGQYPYVVERVFALGAAGPHDREMAPRLTAEGFRSARSERLPVALVGEIRRARGHISLTEPCRTQAKLDGQWTVCGLAQELAGHRHWLYTHSRNGTLPATRHPVLGQYLLPDAPALLSTLRAQRERCGSH